MPGRSLTFTPGVGPYTISLTAFDHQGFAGSTSQTVIPTPVAPTPYISGLPTGKSPMGSPVTLTAMATDTNPAATAAGFNYVWSVSAGSGQQIVAGQNLTFNGFNPIALPSGLLSSATSLSITVTFQTTGSGVILAAQDQPVGSTPVNFAPVLYVGTDGYLHAELDSGTIYPFQSLAKVTDGQSHTAILTWSGNNKVAFDVDGTEIGVTTGTPAMLNMPYALLGTGYTTSWPDAPGGVFPVHGDDQQLHDRVGRELPARGDGRPHGIIDHQPDHVHAPWRRPVHDRPVGHGCRGHHGHDEPVVQPPRHDRAGDRRPCPRPAPGHAHHGDGLRHRQQPGPRRLLA